jgi:hypothetical protein
LTFWLPGIGVAAITLKDAAVCPGEIPTVAGASRRELALAIATVAPVTGAPELSVTLHVPVVPAVSDGGQFTLETVGTTIAAGPDATTASALPKASTPTTPDIVTEVVLAVGPRVTCTLATTPAAMVLAFRPVIRHVVKPGCEAHTVFLAAGTKAGPSTTFSAAIWPGVDAKVNWSPAGMTPVTESATLRVVVPFWTAVPEDRFRLDWASRRFAPLSKVSPASAQLPITEYYLSAVDPYYSEEAVL